MDAIFKSLSFNPQLFLIQAVLFILLWAFMGSMFFKPFMAHLAERDRRIDDAYKSVQTTQHEMESLRAEYLARIAQVEAEARGRIQTAIKEAQSEREQILGEAREHAEQAIHTGVEELSREKIEALESLRSRMAGLAVEAVRKALGAAADTAGVRSSIDAHVAREAAQ